MIDYDNPLPPLNFADVQAMSRRLRPFNRTPNVVVMSTPMSRAGINDLFSEKYNKQIGHLMHGVKFIIDDNLPPSELKYPTGYKDGNKLGKRKREMVVHTMYAFQKDILNSLDRDITKMIYKGRI